MNIKTRSIKFVFTAGVLFGFLPVLFGAPHSNASAPKVQESVAPAKEIVVPRSALTNEERIILAEQRAVETSPPPQPVVTEYPEGFGQCASWMHAAFSVGWPANEWATMDRIMYRESRCIHTSFNETDPNGGSWGLMQINGFWCKPNRWTDRGFLQDHGVLNSCDELFNPYVNMRAALAIWQYGEDQHGCGWKAPWLISCKK